MKFSNHSLLFHYEHVYRILSGGKEKVAVEELERLIERYEISHETKIVLGGIMQDLRVKNALEN